MKFLIASTAPFRPDPVVLASAAVPSGGHGSGSVSGRTLWRGEGRLAERGAKARDAGGRVAAPGTLSLARLGTRGFHVSTPARAVSKRAGGQVRALRVSTPRHTGRQPQVSRAPLQSQYPMAITARRLVSRHPSQYPEAHGPSVPRARLAGAQLLRAHHLTELSDQRPSQRAPGSPAERDSACPGRPPDRQRRGPSSRAWPSAPQRPRVATSA
jgi:hypothetical protein